MPSGIGSGNPYRGSGFVNFDKFLNEQNMNWGKANPTQNENTFGNPSQFDNWISGAANVRQPEQQVKPDTNIYSDPMTTRQQFDDARKPKLPWDYYMPSFIF